MRAPGRAGREARAMEQRLAEFREARKRAGLAAEPGTSSQSAQTSGKKAEAAATPKAAPGWLKRFLVWKPRPANIRAHPSLTQVRGSPRPPGPGFWDAVVASQKIPAEATPTARPPRGGLQATPPPRSGPRPPREGARAASAPLVPTFADRAGLLAPPACWGPEPGVSGHTCQH